MNRVLYSYPLAVPLELTGDAEPELHDFPILDLWNDHTLMCDVLAEYKLGTRDLWVLCLVSSSKMVGRETSVSDIVRMRKENSRITTMRAVKALEEGGWLTRARSQEDCRNVSLSLTPQAVDLLRRLNRDLVGRRRAASAARSA